MLSSVLFPQPDGPIRHNSSPGAMSNEVSSSALTLRASPSSPKRCDTLLMRIAVSMLLLRQKLLGGELAHVRLVRQQARLDERARQNVERLWLEPPVEAEHRHDLVVVLRRDGLRHVGHARRDLDRLVLVVLHPAHALEPAGEEG